MQAEYFGTGDSSILDSTNAPRIVRVVIAYSDVAAGKRAMRLVTKIAETSGGKVDFQAIPWSFQLLANSEWQEDAANDALKADILIFATSGANALPHAVGWWAEEVISRKRGTTTAVVALLGREHNAEKHASPGLRSLQAATKLAGLDFLAPTQYSNCDDPVERAD